jgi:hypothetical protein
MVTSLLKAEKLPASKWPGLLDLGVTALERKDVLIFDADPTVMKLVDARGWSGRVKATDTDYLWVIDTNLAALKTDGVMDKEIRYAVDLTSPDGPTATVKLAYTNTNTKIDWRYSRYRDYVRVYVPEGSELVSSNGAMQTDKNKAGGKVVPGMVEVYRDLGKTVFAAFWAIEPGESRTLSFTYRLPTPVADALRLGAYRLLVQKQPGSKARLTVDAAPAEIPDPFALTDADLDALHPHISPKSWAWFLHLQASLQVRLRKAHTPLPWSTVRQDLPCG